MDDSIIVRRLIKKLPNIFDITKMEIYLVYVSNPYPHRVYGESAMSDFYVGVKQHRDSNAAFAKKLFNSYKKFLEQAKTLELVHYLDEDIPSGIISAAKKNKVDLVVMASNRYSGIKSIILGNNVHDVIVNSKHPILVL